MKRLVCAIVTLLALLVPVYAVEIGDDGLHKEVWFSLTFKDIGEDIAAANAEGKRLAIIIEQRGCIYCKEMHEKVFSDPEVADFIKANFMVVQYNMFGDEEITDLDGEALTEKSAMRKWRVVFTPTIIFLPEQWDGSINAMQAAVEVMPGAFGKWTSLNMFRWVQEKGYETDEHFQSYHARIINQLREAGRLDAQ